MRILGIDTQTGGCGETTAGIRLAAERRDRGGRLIDDRDARERRLRQIAL